MCHWCVSITHPFTQDDLRAVVVSALVPSLGELRVALMEDSDGAQVAAAFDVDDLAAAKSALRDLVMGWEQAVNGPEAGADGAARQPGEG